MMQNNLNGGRQELNLLLADDDADDCLLFKEALEDFPLPVNLTTAENGQELLSLLNSMKLLPDAIFLDLNMPRVNGADCLQEIKQIQRLKNLPVIIYSTCIEKNIANTLYKQGAIFYIRKPSEFHKLCQIIHYSLNLLLQNQFKRTKENFLLNNIVS